MANGPSYHKPAREDRPYIPWYYKDWLTSPDRFSMTYEQRGVYRDLLDFAWDQRGLPIDKDQIRAMLGLDKRKFSLIWPIIGRHFIERDGRLVNAKQERVRARMDAYLDRKREAGGKGGKQRAANLADVKQEAKQNPSTATPSATPSASSEPVAESKPSFAFACSSSKEIPPVVPPDGGTPPKQGSIIARGETLAFDRQMERYHAACHPEICTHRGTSKTRCMSAAQVTQLAGSLADVAADVRIEHLILWAQADAPEGGTWPGESHKYWAARFDASHPTTGARAQTKAELTKAAVKRFVERHS